MIKIGYDFDNENLNKIKNIEILPWIFLKIN